MLNVPPRACIAIADLPATMRPFIGSSDLEKYGQVEIRCISKVSEQSAKDLADLVVAFLKGTYSLPWNGATTPLNLTNIYQVPDVSEDMSIWLEILTIDYVLCQ
jgi:hypothetical protein